MSDLKSYEMSTYWLCDIHLSLSNLGLLICLSKKNKKKVVFRLCSVQIKKGPKSEDLIDFSYLFLFTGFGNGFLPFLCL